MKIEKVNVIGSSFTYSIQLSNIELYCEGYEYDEEDEDNITIYNGATEQEICSVDFKDIKNGNELWNHILGSHALLKGILNFANL